MREKDIELVIECDGCTAGVCQERREFGKKRKRREKKGESGLREKSVFLLFL